MPKRTIFSSESVAEGHPDKVCDTISDAILDACLTIHSKSRVACETYAKSNVVIVGGEISIPSREQASVDSLINISQIVRDVIREIGYIHDEDVFHADKVFIQNILTSQSGDIAQGVDTPLENGHHQDHLHHQLGAGDQGLMFGFACDETPELMPAPIMYAHRLGRELTRLRKLQAVPWLRPDAKTQVSVEYEEGKPVGIRNVVLSTQHTEEVSRQEIEAFVIEEVIRKVLPQEVLSNQTEFFINPTGRFVIGGPQGDTGLTGRKIIVDTYGGRGRHGGGAFSGKDPTKVDRSAAYMGRYVAKNVVAAGLASSCEVQFAYAIGYPKPVSISVNTFGTATIAEELIEKAIEQVFSFRPVDIIETLKLERPIYSQTTNYGHFGKIDDVASLTWEKTDRAEELREATQAVLM